VELSKDIASTVSPTKYQLGLDKDGMESTHEEAVRD
jgi:hypothetical protein